MYHTLAMASHNGPSLLIKTLTLYCRPHDGSWVAVWQPDWWIRSQENEADQEGNGQNGGHPQAPLAAPSPGSSIPWLRQSRHSRHHN